MQLYGIVGTSELYAVAEGLEYALPAGAVAVDTERPAPEAVLLADGTWQLPETPVELDVPVGEIDALISAFPTIGWAILAQMGIE